MYRSIPSFFKTVLLSIVGGSLIAVASSSKASAQDDTDTCVPDQAPRALVASDALCASRMSRGSVCA